MAETKAAMEMDQMLNSLKWGDERPQEERKEVSISFPKGCAKEFTGKDGKEYMRISIPMDQAQDSNKAWPSFVLPAEQVKENDSGKSLWAKIAKDGKTTLSVSEQVGTKEDGSKEYKTMYAKIDNQDLKVLMDKSKERSQERSFEKAEEKTAEKSEKSALKAEKGKSDRVSFKEQLGEKKAEMKLPEKAAAAVNRSDVSGR